MHHSALYYALIPMKYHMNQIKINEEMLFPFFFYHLDRFEQGTVNARAPTIG